ncbi:MAG: hypothetical protein HY600_01140 [Candidatus Omnitrophica bacterium]|nr:hypothetical protein [Candidatus Omnitrophota bacterium]
MRLTSLNELLHAGERVEGTWALTPYHTLQYRRHRKREGTIVLTGDLVGAESTGLTLQVTGQTVGDDLVGRTLTLRGRWQVDAMNRLTFFVEREGGRYDRLTLHGAWGLGRRHELRYHVRQSSAGGPSPVQTLTFAGAWALSERRRLTYVVEGGRGGAFRLRGTFQTPSILAKTGELRYQLGVEAAGRRRLQTLTFFGTWRVSRTLEVTFELPMGGGRAGALRFGAEYSTGPRGAITAALTAPGGQPLGLEVVFTRELWRGQGEAFIRLRRALEETAVEGGVRGRW